MSLHLSVLSPVLGAHPLGHSSCRPAAQEGTREGAGCRDSLSWFAVQTPPEHSHDPAVGQFPSRDTGEGEDCKGEEAKREHSVAAMPGPRGGGLQGSSWWLCKCRVISALPTTVQVITQHCH